MKRPVLLSLLLAPFVSVNVPAQNAADVHYGRTAMEAARARIRSGHGAQVSSLIQGERFEYQFGEGDPNLLWEGAGWIGGDLNKFWIKAEGQYAPEASAFEEVELQALYSRAVSPFWDLQAGLRHDIKPDPHRSYAVISALGVAPYWVELDCALFVSDRGILSARVEAEYEFRLTQRLQLQPRIELNGALSDDEDRHLRSGLSTAEAGLSLIYEIRREFAPYVGFNWTRSFGRTADLPHLHDNDTQQLSLVAGIRFWL